MYNLYYIKTKFIRTTKLDNGQKNRASSEKSSAELNSANNILSAVFPSLSFCYFCLVLQTKNGKASFFRNLLFIFDVPCCYNIYVVKAKETFMSIKNTSLKYFHVYQEYSANNSENI